MKMTKKLSLLLILIIAVWALSQERVHADNPCQQACANPYNSCVANAADQYNSCMIGPESAYNTCELEAYDQYDDCLAVCDAVFPQWTGCYPYCMGSLQYFQANCQSAYSSAESNCSYYEWQATEICGTAYFACYNNCPP